VQRLLDQATLADLAFTLRLGCLVCRLLLTAAEQLTQRGQVRLRAGLTAGDPTDEVAAAWQGKELLRAVYAADSAAEARVKWRTHQTARLRGRSPRLVA
jgi:hypothetical protein